jgi:DNA-binding NarL/FixJ family response regulator
VGDKSALGWALRSLAEVVRHTGDRQKADELLGESRELFRELGRRDVDQATQPSPEPGSADQAEESNEEGLTRREVEVLKLIARGLSDAQIADDLCLSIRTVQAHVRSIYVKIDVTNRSAATRWALERKLT